MMTFGQYVRARREEKGFSLRKFAEEVGLSAGFISQMERDRTLPGIEALKRMAVALEENADEFLARAGKVDPALVKIIIERPREMATLLRVARWMTGEQIQRLLQPTEEAHIAYTDQTKDHKRAVAPWLR